MGIFSKISEEGLISLKTLGIDLEDFCCPSSLVPALHCRGRGLRQQLDLD